MVVTVEVDVHEVDRGAVAVAAAGRRPGGQPTVRTTGTGHRDLPRRVPWGSTEQAVQFTVEDRRPAPPRLQRELPDAAAAVVREPPAPARTGAPARDRSAPVDGPAVTDPVPGRPELPRADRTCVSRHPSRTDTAAPARLPAAA